MPLPVLQARWPPTDWARRCGNRWASELQPPAGDATTCGGGCYNHLSVELHPSTSDDGELQPCIREATTGGV